MTIVETILAWLLCFALIGYWLLAQFAAGMASSGNVDLGRGPRLCLIFGMAGIAALLWTSLT